MFVWVLGFLRFLFWLVAVTVVADPVRETGVHSEILLEIG